MCKKRCGEDGILDLIAKYFPNQHPYMPMGRGDDCALIAVPPAPYCANQGAIQREIQRENQRENQGANQGLDTQAVFAVTSDIFAENAHFRTSYFTASDIGHKALAVNISDLASNGAKPCAFSFNLTVTEKQDFAWLEACFKSMAELANSYDMVLCGGDLTKVPLAQTLQKKQDTIDPLTCGGLNIGITAWGTYEHGGVPLLRHRSYAHKAKQGFASNVQAKACMQEGDILFYIGQIGLARLGLFCLEEKQNLKNCREQCLKEYPHAAMAHLRPQPLVREGLLLSQFAKEHALFVMDISDGLMRDIPRLLARQGIIFADEEAFGADIVLYEAMLHPESIDYCKKKNLDPCLFAYKGGEDYGLVGVCEKDAFALLQKYCAEQKIQTLHKLGTVTKGEINLNSHHVQEAGFDHFQ